MKIEGKQWIGGAWIDVPEDQIKKPKKKRDGISGIYVIEVPSIKSAYVGQSVNVYSRFSQHRHVLKQGKCQIKEMQAAWDKYSSEFVFKILEETGENLKMKEKTYAEQYLHAGYELFNSYFLIETTAMIIEKAHMPVFQKMMKLIARKRFDIEEFDAYLDTL